MLGQAIEEEGALVLGPEEAEEEEEASGITTEGPLLKGHQVMLWHFARSNTRVKIW